MRRASLAGVVVILAFAVAACTPSRVKPEARVDIGGSVRTVDGAVGGTRLALQREGDVGDVLLTITSLGFACVSNTDAPAK